MVSVSDSDSHAGRGADPDALHGPHERLLRLLGDAPLVGDRAAVRATGELVAALARLSVELRLRSDHAAGRLLLLHPDQGGQGVSIGRELRRLLGVNRSSSARLRRFAAEVDEAELERIVDRVWEFEGWVPAWSAASCVDPPPSGERGG